ncbi:YqcC family protein [Lacimicrobium alkaliphilum]|uniref:YqcC-like domain-containing protein n=1 Tax=Lacimicrobium alkaliphilum TaxID=1526571 RepID=A0ABQ1RE95_9ALTE|nr:YqcC family protein [Lacimicrobium alkaliphilum]GGD66868.1 hypothetical protein GCM10011357_22620 [Lacimicrobium alkaliphilum]
MSTDSNKHNQTFLLLSRLRLSLEQQQMWQREAPSATALASAQPFCCDTLKYEQWLQFVFIPRMQALCRHRQPLPGHMSLLPMAEQAWPEKTQHHELMQILHDFDQLYSQEP